MTASTEAATEIREAPVSAALARAEGVELLGDVHGSGYERGAALVRRADGQMVQLGPLMYALLECVDGQRSITELSSCMSEQIGRDFDEEHVVALAQKLGAQGLLAGTEENAPERSNPLLALRWKVLITNPRVTKWLTAPFTGLYRPWIAWPVLAAFAAVVVYVLFFKGVSAATADAFHDPALLLLVFGLAIASAAFHEIGHASAARYGGATPGGMGAGIYMVWPAFYTDVTDAYRLPRGARLRVDLGGIYFNAVVSVATFAAWFAWRVDALLLVIALQLLMIVKNLSPVIRSDGYHILADATGVPDLYAHIVPTLRRLIPWRPNEPSALKGRARALVTLWVLVVVPVLLSLMIGAVLLLPRLLTSTWDSGRAVLGDVSHDASNGDVLMLAVSLLRLLALVLPLLGSVLLVQMLGRMIVRRAQAWSEGSPARGAVVSVVGAAALVGAAWALWPAGQYQPVRAADRGTLVSFTQALAAPASVARPTVSPFANVQHVLTPGRHLAMAMIPVGGATKEHPAFFIVGGVQHGDHAVMLVSDTTPDPADAPTMSDPTAGSSSSATSTATPSPARVFPFKLPSKPGPGDTQALATGTQDGGVTYDIAYSVVTVKNGADVKNTNSAYALASCNACTTIAVSFQVVLVVGQSNVITPVNIAEALNNNCPSCVTAAIADQIVVTITKLPTQELLDKLNASLAKLGALSTVPLSQLASTVMAVQHEIEQELNDSGLLANPPASTTTSATTTGATSTQSSTTTAQTTTAATTTSPAAAPAPATTTAPAQTTPTATTTTPTTTAETTTTSTTTAETTTTTG